MPYYSGPPQPRERIEELRDKGFSLFDAQKILLREQLEYEVSDINHIEDVRMVLYKIVETLLPKTEDSR